MRHVVSVKNTLSTNDILLSAMNTSGLDLRGFDIAPDSPASVRNLHLDLDEFDDPSQLQRTFCRQMSAVEFEQEGVTATEKALQVAWHHQLSSDHSFPPFSYLFLSDYSFPRFSLYFLDVPSFYDAHFATNIKTS